MLHVEPNDYRTRIYEHYATEFQGAGDTFDERRAARSSKAYRYYLRGWLPGDCNASVVDVGCGQGNLLYFFRQQGYGDVSGVDVSPDQVRIARQVLPSVEQENALDFLSRRPAAFDLITALDVIEHFRKPEVMQFLDECYRALRPGGRLILQTVNADSPWGSQLRYGDFTHEVAFNSHVLSRLLRICGFAGAESREVGPVPVSYSLASSVRSVAWSVIRTGLFAWNLAETGHQGSSVLTRTFLISATREQSSLSGGD